MDGRRWVGVLGSLALLLAACDQPASVKLALQEPTPSGQCRDDEPPDLVALYERAAPEAARERLTLGPLVGPIATSVRSVRISARQPGARSADDAAMAAANAVIRLHVEDRVTFARAVESSDCAAIDDPEHSAACRLRARLAVPRARHQAGWRVVVVGQTHAGAPAVGAEPDGETVGFVDLEVRPRDPYSVELNYFVKEGQLYIDPAEGRRWYGYLKDDPDVRVRFGGKIYPVRAVFVGGPGEVEGFDPGRYVYRLESR